MADRLIHSPRLRLLAGVFVATVGLVALCALALARRADAQPSCAQSGATVTCTFSYTGDAQTWTVPPDVTAATFDVQGAQGGVGAGLNSPGLGGEATADLALTPGASVTLVVGGQGGSPGPCSGAGGGGFNGGAAGGPFDFFGCVDGGGGGGGASDVRIGGSDLTDRVLVAGGGGGTSAGIGCGNGGGGGGLTGDAGTPGINNCGSVGGEGGDQTGASGSGQLGVGSVGAELGGGGGGGYFGGGGGGESGGGGGGSGFGPVAATFQTDVRSGDGTITVSYTAPTASITTPADGATYALDQTVESSFSCTDISGGPGIQSCVDQNGNPSGTPIDTSTAGPHTFTVTATNKDGLTGTASVSYTVAKGSQAVAFTSSPPSPAVFGGSYALTATGGASGNPVVFSVDASSGAGVCVLDASGTMVSFTGAGRCVIDADQAGDADYDAAAQRQQSFTVVKASQVVAFTSSPPSPAVFGGSYALTATGGASGNPVVFSVDASSGAGVCVLDASGTMVSFTGAGRCVIDADQAGDADYDAAAQRQQSFTVVKASQVVAFTSSPPSPAVFGGSYALTATGGASGNPVVFSVDASSGAGVCVLDASGTMVSFTGAGRCVVDADQAGDADYDAAAQQQQSFTVEALPSARITSPADNQTFALSQHVATSFSCTPGADGPGISSCTDSNGASAPAGVLDTSKTGTFTYTVTATSKDGQKVRASIYYTVAAAPSVQVRSPADGATYTHGHIIAADYDCRDGTSGPGIRSCAGPVTSGAPIDTSQPGPHAFTVVATSIDGQRTAVTVHYTVVRPSNEFTVRHLRVRRKGIIEFDVTVPHAGQLDVLETAWNDNLAHAASVLQPAPRRFVFARAHKSARRAETLHFRVRPNARGRLLVRHHRYDVTLRLWVTYTPAGGTDRKQGFYGLHLPKPLNHARAVRGIDQLPR